MDVDALARQVESGQVPALARACRVVDERAADHEALLEALYPASLAAWWVGVTGSPGAGKSTLVNRLIERYRSAGKRVGVVAVDPTSPFSGGAILGDRIRMQEHFQDAEVFIRSLATRGALGGLSHTTADVARVIAAWGADLVLIETVGVGQDELDVMRIAHTTLVVQAPGAGDDVQAAKAGLLECADVFAVNKADRPGADQVVQQLRAMIALGAISTSGGAPGARGHGVHSMERGSSRELPVGAIDPEAAWEVPVAATVATTGEGVAELAGWLDAHRAWLTEGVAGRSRRERRAREELEMRVHRLLVDSARSRHGAWIARAMTEALEQGRDPYSASREIVATINGASDS